MINIGRSLKSNFPKSLNPQNEVFSALIANKNETGTIETALKDAQEYAKDIMFEENFYNFNTDLFSFAAQFFAPKEMFSTSIDTMKKRMKNVFQRNGRKVWGTITDFKKTLQEFFEGGQLFFFENVGEENLIMNGNFEAETLVDWIYENYGTNVILTQETSFQGVQCVGIKDTELSQVIINCDPSMYYLHFFSLGHGKIRIQYYSNGNYVTLTEIEVNSANWKQYQLKFNITENTSIKVSFISETEDFYFIDYVQLFKYVGYPSFLILNRYVGQKNSNKRLFFNEQNDNNPAYNSLDSGFFAGDNVVASQEYIRFLIDYLRPVGVRGFYQEIDKIVSEQEWAYVEGKTLVLPYGQITDESTLNVNRDIDNDTLNA